MTRTDSDINNPSLIKVARQALNLGVRRLMERLILLACVCLVAWSSVSAQNVQITQGSVGSGLDNSIQIPITSYPGRGGASLPVSLYYSSKVWRIGHLKTVHLNNSAPRSVAEAIYAEHSTSGWTMSLDVPKVEWPKQNDLYWYSGKPYHASHPPYTYRVPNVFIHMPDGSTHELRRSDQIYADNGTVSMTGIFYAMDGSRLRYDSTSQTSGTLYMPDGSRYVLSGANAQFIDRNGNALSFDGATRQWTDTLGTLRGSVGMPWPASPQAGSDYSYAPPGLTSPYVFKWRSLSDALTPDAQGQTPALKAMSDFYLPQPGQAPTNQNGSNFPQSAGTQSLFFSAYGDEFADNPELTFTNVVGRGQSQGQVFNPVVLAEVVLPNGLSYKFSYNVYGEIDKIVYPTGGYERSQYDAVAAMGNVKPPYSEGSRGVKFRWVSPNGTGGTDELPPWKYEPSLTSLNSYMVKVTAPDGTYTKSYRHNFYSVSGETFGYQDTRSGMTYDVQSYDASGTMLRRTLTEWTQTSANHTGPAPGVGSESTVYTEMRNARPTKSVSLILDTGGAALAKKITYQYGAADPNNAWAIETTTGLDRTGMTESHFADGIDQATAQTGTIATISNNYYYPPASSSETVYVPDQSYRARNILGLVSSVVLKDAADNPVSKTETFYDEAAFPLITYGDLVGDAGYVDPGGSTIRGNPTTVRRYVDLALGSYLETHAQFDQCGNSVNFWNERAASPFTESNANSKKVYSSAHKHAYLTQATSITPDPSGQHGSNTPFTSSSIYDTVTGSVLTATDANDHVTTFSYKNDQNVQDPLNRLRKVTRPDGGWTKTSYNDVVGNLYVHVESKLDATRSTHAYQFFDKLGRASRSFALEAGLTYLVSETKYDQMGRANQASNPFRTTVNGGGDPSQPGYWVTANGAAFWTTNIYDALGRVKVVTLPDGATVQTDYDGIYTTVTDQAGKQRRQKTDALGRVVRVDEPDAAGSPGATGAPVQPSFYEYDTQGNIVRINQGLTQQGANPESAASYTQHRYFKYDALSRLTHERQLEQAGTITAADALTGNAAWSRRLTYDETVNDISFKGLLTSAEDARHVVTRLYYDQMSRAYQVTYTDGTPSVESKYDQPGVGYFNKGRLTEVKTAATASVPQTSQLYDYDLMGRTVRQRQVVDVNTYTLSYTYNVGGALTSQTYPSGKVITYGYDAAARLSSVSSGATTYASSMTYKPFGGLEAMALGNGASYSMSYSDTRLQLASITLTQGANVVQKYEYKYGQVSMSDGGVDETKNNGQIGRIEGFIGTQKQWQQRFTYDTPGRLSSAGEYQGDNGEQSYLLNYDYDTFGNRYQKQQRNPNNPVAQSWVEDGSFEPLTNRFTSGITYDDAGNITVDSRFRNRKFEYDANNRLKQTSNLDNSNPVTSVYDGAGQRVATKAGGVLTNVMVYDAFGKLVAEYGQNVSNAGTSYVMGDHQGSTRVVMNTTGVNNGIVSRHDYLPFGEDISSSVGMRATTFGYSQPDGVRQKYAGMEGDEATGMSHTLWREFDNISARWTAPDPYGGSMSLSSPQSFNRYIYVNNDPVNQTDPTGLMAASQGWGSASANFWGGDPGFFDPHFGGPGIIAEAQANFDRGVADTMETKRINDLIKKGLITEEQAREMIKGNDNLSLVTTSVTVVENNAAAQQQSGSSGGAERGLTVAGQTDRELNVGAVGGENNGVCPEADKPLLDSMKELAGSADPSAQQVTLSGHSHIEKGEEINLGPAQSLTFYAQPNCSLSQARGLKIDSIPEGGASPSGFSITIRPGAKLPFNVVFDGPGKLDFGKGATIVTAGTRLGEYLSRPENQMRATNFHIAGCMGIGK
jgi:RHS repeat-associated protein